MTVRLMQALHRKEESQIRHTKIRSGTETEKKDDALQPTAVDFCRSMCVCLASGGRNRATAWMSKYFGV
jgi:hypothetical protein